MFLLINIFSIQMESWANEIKLKFENWLQILQTKNLSYLSYFKYECNVFRVMCYFLTKSFIQLRRSINKIKLTYIKNKFGNIESKIFIHLLCLYLFLVHEQKILLETNYVLPLLSPLLFSCGPPIKSMSFEFEQENLIILSGYSNQWKIFMNNATFFFCSTYIIRSV